MAETVIVGVIVCIALAGWSLVVAYQHDQIRREIIERAKAHGCSNIKRLEKALDEMLGPEMRAFGMSDDDEFQKKLDEIMSV